MLLPGAMSAEPWELWILGPTAEPRCSQICATPRDNRIRRSTTLALPAAQVFCLPLWLNETDPVQFPEMISLQLELRGMQPRGNGSAVFDWTIIAREATRTLVTVGVLPSSLPADVEAEAYTTFDLSARYLGFPENTITLWKEQNQWVVGVSRGKDLVYYQVLGEGPITARIAQDLACIQATLAMQEISLPLQQIMLWSEATQPEIDLLQATLQLTLKKTELPPPRAPTLAWRLTPSSVGAAKRNREVRRWWTRGIAAVLAIYFMIVLALAARFLLISHRIDDLHKWQSEHAQTIALVRDTRAAWKELGPVVDTNHYPLELLLHTSEAIPDNTLHLTLFESGGDHVLIKGEAKNAAAAFQFLDKLKGESHLAGYTWDMGQPHLLPNDLAQLQIEGNFANSN